MNLDIDIASLPEDRMIPDRLGKLFWYFMKQAKGLLLLMIITGGAVAVLNALMPYYIGVMIDIMTDYADDPDKAIDLITPVFIVFVALCLVAKVILGLINEHYTIMKFDSKFGNLIRRQCHWYTQRHSLEYFQSDFAGRVANKVQQIGPSVRDVLSQTIGSVLYVLVFGISAMLLMSSADIRLLIPMLIWVAMYLVILRVFVPQVRSKSIALSDAQSQFVGRIVDSYTNIMTVKLFARKKHEDEFVLQSLKAHTEKFQDKNRRIFVMICFLNIMNALMIAGITIFSLYLWRVGAVTTGQVAMILPLAIHLNHQMHWIMWEMTGIFQWIGMVEDSMQTISQPHRVIDNKDAAPIKISDGHIKYDDVSFHYGKENGGIIDNFTLDIPAGQKIGLVGHSGAGKSTLANILLRFYDLEDGQILIDGQNVAAHTQDSLRNNITMVTQDTSLLHRSITDNISYGKSRASMDEIIEAAKKAQAHEFILDLEDKDGRKGYDAHVGERGVKLSGGQRQRIAIARIILKDAPILILDEATSALDSETESYIQDQLTTLMKDKTVIAIAHRLSTISYMDRLIIMHEGKIIEDGTHNELLKIKGGHYARMWALQSGGFLPE